MRCLGVFCLLLIACAKQEPPVQDPLDYLRVGVDPREETAAIIRELERNGFEVGRRIDEENYVAFDAVSGPESLVRIVTSRGVALTLEAPDVRWPERLWVSLSAAERPDFDRDGRRDVLVAMRERERTCLAWAQVDRDGFATEVFRPKLEWGDAPCVIDIDPAWPRLLLEVSVPDATRPGARVRVPIRATAQGWSLDDSARAAEQWDSEIAERRKALQALGTRPDASAAERLRAEIDWLEQLRTAVAPVLEPADDGEEAR